ncbi:MAG: phenylalanine--tRNA ligase subunit beta [Acidiferrobacteraceae bacterium]
MKISEQWLRAWSKTDLDSSEIAACLTAGGIEVASVTPIAGLDSKVVAGIIMTIEPHPNADRLRCCTVDAGTGAPLTIVCGATNAAPGLNAPVALVGATLPGGVVIRDAKIRGMPSQGMLCSTQDLGLETGSSGLLALDLKTRRGTPVATLLELPDQVLELEITPNRGDCLSVLGVAREIEFLTGASAVPATARPSAVGDLRAVSVSIEAHEACPRYAGRPIYGLDPAAMTPLWMRERLRRCGVHSIHPVVDVTNYVMLEWGQPMHGFALPGITQGIVVRHAKKAESLTLLDGDTVSVDAGTLLIADHKHPLAIAGVMGGLGSAIAQDTVDIFLESAYFRPESIAASARRLGLHTDSSHRFERGVDPTLVRRALERATQLLLAIAGGRAGPISEVTTKTHMPKRPPVRLRRARLSRMLGIDLRNTVVNRMLARIDPKVKKTATGWRMKPPAHRFDLKEECDLIEEVARGYGYDQIPAGLPRAILNAQKNRNVVSRERIRALLVDHDYHEAITYSFVGPELEAVFDPGHHGPVLANPIASNLAVMRTGLAVGLLQALAHNRRHQQERVRLFELGLCFRQGSGGVDQRERLGLIASGRAWPRQWGAPDRKVDLYDVKADLMALLTLGGQAQEFTFRGASVPGLHPGQTAEITFQGRPIGYLGTVHPEVQKHLEIDDSIILLDIELEVLLQAKSVLYAEIPRVPSIRRDLAIVVARTLPAQVLTDCIRVQAGALLKELEIFDEYRGEGIDSGRKSVAVTLTLQDSSRTLTEDTVEAVIARVVSALATECDAQLRQ